MGYWVDVVVRRARSFFQKREGVVGFLGCFFGILLRIKTNVTVRVEIKLN